MDVLVVVLVLAVVAAAAVWWFRRRRNQPSEDEAEWILPPEEAVHAPSQDAGPQFFDRGTLLNRNRVLDPSKWDNTPDDSVASGDGDAVPDDLPRFFDREYLQQRSRKEPES